MNLVTAEHLTKSYTERLLFDDTDFSINEGDKIGLIGINGTGKSTLLKLVAGLEEPDSGRIVRGRNLDIRYLPQNPVFHPGETVLESVLRENEGHEHVWDIESQAKSMLNRLGIPDFNEKVEHLSGGQKKRAALASVLLSTAELLILDEPTNHLDSEMADWLEDYLKKFKGALLMITHDRYFLDSVTNRIVELDNGKLYSYQANYEGFLELKAERMDMEKASERKRQSILRTELAWMQRGARARSTKQKGRIQRFETLRDKKGPVEDGKVEMESISSRLGRTTIEISDLCKSYGDKVLVKDYTYFFLKDDRIGYIGPNGSGKSTLMKMIAGWVKPDSGTIEIGQTVKLGYFSQENEDMDTSLKVIDYIKNVAEYVKTKDGSISASQMLERFLFPPSVQYTVIEKLSGGERRRLYLLKILMSAPNVLILDEPTNDLDIQTLMILEDYLDSFQGIVITVSHDRYFLDRTVTRVIEIQEGKAEFYSGNYSFYAVEKERRFEERQRQYEKEQAKIQQLEKAAEQLRTWAYSGMDKTFKRVKSMEKRIERMRVTDRPKKARKMEVRFGEREFRGDEVLTIKHLKKSFGSRTLFDDVNLEVAGGERIALLGDNGTGKSTLIKILMGEESPDEGKLRLGPTVKIGYLPQIIHFDHPERSLVDTMIYDLDCTAQTARNRLAAFQFKGEDVFKPVSALSGGEQSRLRLCMLMDAKINLLILDEPTNHLDIQSREWIEEAVEEYEGNLLFVSHDRYFIDRFATRIWMLEGGHITDFKGTYQEYLAMRQRQKNQPQPAAQVQAQAPKEKKEKPKRPGGTKNLEKEVAAAERAVAKAEERMFDLTQEMEAAAADYLKLQDLYEQKEALEEEILKLYGKWEDLSAQLEEARG